ncbi:hypothetical protein FE634_21835 [Nocardioides dongxiaopingii]|uniref:helix-turn-helix domain-containing protein n=1 Tax=Nocardioides sp. S-1144 TaxID=2582905 RepID=UPI0011654134|nr:helix-turn-helix domain-containing protein [Nocardioides sp. S-1144]QDH10979.1 hypothetical protein FE634_21835 [Nocardioides sp. S-1144]
MSTDLIDPTVSDVPDDLPEDDVVEVRRDGPLSAVVGGVGAAVAVAYLVRAVGSGAPLDWALCLVTGLIGLLHLAAFVDSRAPLLVLDRHGVRVRRGREWQGVAWPEVERVEHRARQTLLRDGSLTVVTVTGARLGARLSLSTRLIGSDWHELGQALGDLSEGRTSVVDLAAPVESAAASTAPAAGSPTEPEPVPDVAVDDTAVRAPLDPDPDSDSVAPVEPSAQPSAQPPAPARRLARGRRTEVVLAPREVADPEATEVFVLPPAEPDAPSEVTTTIVIDEASTPPAVAPVVGPQLAAARGRLGLSVDQVAERTRIRPHVIESIEADDFAPCGGDFYARGHLRTLARILGVDVEPLLATYDETYADAPIDPRRVFEAELATGAGGPIRGTRGRLNWSILVAAVMAVVLLWSVARLVMDGPIQPSDQPVLNGSPSGRAQLSGSSVTKVPVTFTAATGGARVTVRDGSGKVVFDEDVAFMQTARVTVAPPVRLESSDGGLTVSVDGDDKGALGASGERAQRTFVAAPE